MASSRSLVRGALLAALLLAATACTLAVDTAELHSGDEGLDCASDEKVCPDRLSPNRRVCVGKTSASYGCGSSACGACTLPNAEARCTKKDAESATRYECAIASCQEDHDDCNEKVTDGCEVDLRRDEGNCGSCRNVCRAANGATACANGQCRIIHCNEPFDNCDDKYGTGCETDLRTSQEHCGACDSPCDGTCTGGVCNP